MKKIVIEALVNVGEEVTLTNGIKGYVTQVSKDLDGVVWYAVKYITADDVKVAWVRRRDISEPTD
jgi:preprotein translocase subunit YajC